MPKKVIAAGPGFSQIEEEITGIDLDNYNAEVAAWNAGAETRAWVSLRERQTSMIEEVRWKVERIITQKELGLAEGQRALTDAQYNDYLQYLQDIRDSDEANHGTPASAEAALDALVKPTH